MKIIKRGPKSSLTASSYTMLIFRYVRGIEGSTPQVHLYLLVQSGVRVRVPARPLIVDVAVITPVCAHLAMLHTGSGGSTPKVAFMAAVPAHAGNVVLPFSV